MRWVTVTLAAVAAALIVSVTYVPAQDLSLEWLAVRGAVDGLPATTGSDELAAIYGAEEKYPEFFGPEADPGTPAQLLVDLPLLALPHEAMPALSVVLTVGGLALTLWVLNKRWRFPAHWLAAAIPLLMLTYPIRTHLMAGQFSLLIAAALAWAMIGRSAVPLGVVVGMKVYLWAAIPALWLSGRRRDAYIAAGTAAGLNLLGLALPGVTIGGLMDLAGSTSGWAMAAAHNGSLASFGVPLFMSVPVVLVAVWRYPDLRMAVPLGMLASPIVWVHYLPVAFVPFAAKRNWWTVGLLAVWLVPPSTTLQVGVGIAATLLLLSGRVVVARPVESEEIERPRDVVPEVVFLVDEHADLVDR